jgi:hypothetical protein
MVSFYPKYNTDWQLTEVVVETHQKNVRFITGYSGDKSPEELAKDFTDKVDIPEMTAKCWTNEDKTVLKAVAVFSKHKAPFNVVVKLKNIPPPNIALNRKYLDLLDGPEGLQRAYDLLKQNRGEYPMVLVAEVTKRFGSFRSCPENGLVNLREEIIYRIERPQDSFEPF